MNHSPSADRLFQAILSLKNVEECYDFFEDICTITEIRDMIQRLDTAFLIDEGISYQKISDRIGVSTATISRVSRCLNYGAGGYRTVIDRLREEEETA
ncbi:YerC/YecD family TrpR-related protein [Ruminococcus sp.]|uniref:YerC/YecD family TrpR-related protein n=1 Tax=Ruminococcus sp. TaxID=41978 RepID=UPI00388F02B4